MDPTVRITETDPQSEGAKVRGHISQAVLLNCYVENLPVNLAVSTRSHTTGCQLLIMSFNMDVKLKILRDT